MRYRGPGTNWWPIVIVVLVAILALILLYYLFVANQPAGVDRTQSPGLTQSPVVTPTGTS